MANRRESVDLYYSRYAKTVSGGMVEGFGGGWRPIRMSYALVGAWGLLVTSWFHALWRAGRLVGGLGVGGVLDLCGRIGVHDWEEMCARWRRIIAWRFSVGTQWGVPGILYWVSCLWDGRRRRV
jgi:hypothetical protein